MTRYYLGIEVEADDFDPIFGGDQWVWATWPDGRRFLHWGDQLEEKPWGE